MPDTALGFLEAHTETSRETEFIKLAEQGSVLLGMCLIVSQPHKELLFYQLTTVKDYKSDWQMEIQSTMLSSS